MKMWQLRYYDSCGCVVALLLWARTKQSLLNKFQRDYGYYTIIDIKEIEQLTKQQSVTKRKLKHVKWIFIHPTKQFTINRSKSIFKRLLKRA